MMQSKSYRKFREIFSEYGRLFYAFWAPKVEIIKVLLTYGVGTQVRGTNGNTALIVTSDSGKTEIVQALLTCGANIEKKGFNGNTALIMASSGGHKETVQVLLAHGADTEVRNDDGSTALIMASSGGHKETVRVLLDHGADITAEDKNGRTAFYWAFSRSDVKTVQVFLADKVGAKAKGKQQGITELTWAVLKGDVEAVQALLADGADIEAKNNDSSTALIAALRFGKKDIVQVLLAHGADIEARDDKGSTALITATNAVPLHHGSIATIQLLKPHSKFIKGEIGDQEKAILSSAYKAFGFCLFHALTEKINQNVFVSPTSIALALSMAYNGADGETRKEMAKTLQLKNMSMNKVNEYCAYLIDMLEIINEMDVKIKCCIANSLWMKRESQVSADFRDCLQMCFEAELGSFAGVPDTINAWVSRYTKSKIQHIIGPEITQEDVVAVLVNAFYFHGKWTEPFEENNTRDAKFTLLRKGKKSCKMMFQGGKYLYLENAQFQAIWLPYGQQQIGMFIFLPQKNVLYSDFLSSLTWENWTTWQGQFQEQKGSIGLPRFRCEYTKNLNAVLSRLGMPSAFNREKADFSGIAPLFCISKVQHKTFLEVTEEGTEAAAITAMVVAVTCGIVRSHPFEMIVDRPFFCAIVDKRTNSILFMGAIIEP